MATSSIARNYLITGAGRGIGRGLSRLLLAKGHRVVLVDVNQEELDHIGSKLAEHHDRGKDFVTVKCNVQHASEIEEAKFAADRLFQGHLDVLVNNAADTRGAGGWNPLSDPSMEIWDSSIATNLTGPMIMSTTCVPLLEKKADARPRGGCIVNMSSTRALMSEPQNEAYATTKAGLLGMTQSMAVSLAPRGVRVNAILPGWINVADESKAADKEGLTWEDVLTPDDHEWHLTGRVGKVEDIFRAVEYLAESEFVTGAEMVVDGGVTRKMIYPEE